MEFVSLTRIARNLGSALEASPRGNPLDDLFEDETEGECGETGLERFMLFIHVSRL